MQSANAENITLRDLAHESCRLSAMIEGLDVLSEQATGPEDCPLSKRARNALQPTLEAVIKAAWALTDRIERADNSHQPKGMAA